MRIITIEINRTTAPHSYDVSYIDEGGKAKLYSSRDPDSGAAAARAISKAIEVEKYIIFGPNEVLKHIPENLRFKN
jgi:hypothetical protein